MWLYLYIYYFYSYLLLFFHFKKEKLIVLVGEVAYNRDYILYYLLLGLVLFYIYRKYQEKSYAFVTWIIGYGLLLAYYGSSSLLHLHQKGFIIENIIFEFFGLLGLVIPLFFLNQLIFLGAFIIFIGIAHTLKYFHINILGVWSSCQGKYWLLLMGILCIYIISSLALEMFFTGGEALVVPSSSVRRVAYQHFTQEDINNIYEDVVINKEKEEDLSHKIMDILKVFQIEGTITKVINSAAITNYFFKPKVGTKTSRIESIEEELSMELGRNVRVATNFTSIIIEVANLNLQSFSFKQIWSCQKKDVILPLFLGFDTLGEKIILDLTKQPHMLMCGTTGSGKSSTLHSIIHSLITTCSPEELKLILIDPKILELSVYKNIPHLWVNIINKLEEAEEVLSKLVVEMEERYKIMSQSNKRSISEYNKNNFNGLPYLVFCIEEFAELALYKNNNFKTLVQRLAQMGRAAGIHGIICTQRPSATIVDGVIKANFPTRIALRVTNKLESRIVLDMSGAEKLSNPGEMIISDASGISKRGLGAYISEKEILALINKLKK